MLGPLRRRTELRRSVEGDQYEEQVVWEIVSRSSSELVGREVAVPYVAEDAEDAEESQARVSAKGTLWCLDGDAQPWHLYEPQWLQRNGNWHEHRSVLIDMHVWNSAKGAPHTVRYEYGGRSGTAMVRGRLGSRWTLEVDGSEWFLLQRIG